MTVTTFQACVQPYTCCSFVAISRLLIATVVGTDASTMQIYAIPSSCCYSKKSSSFQVVITPASGITYTTVQTTYQYYKDGKKCRCEGCTFTLTFASGVWTGSFTVCKAKKCCPIYITTNATT